MKILIIAPRLPYPPDKGDKLTIFNYIKYLSKHHDIYLFTFFKGKEKKHIKNIGQFCKRFIAIPHSNLYVVKNCLKTFLGLQSFQQSYYCGNRYMQEAILTQIKNDPPDIIYCHTLRMAEYVRNIQKIPKILALQISLALNYRRLKNYSRNYLEKFFYSIEYRLIKKYEFRICSSFDKVLLISKKDLQEIEDNAGIKIKNIEFLPHGVDHIYFQPKSDVETKSNTIVMTGNMGYPPNQDAAIYFAKEIFPLIKNRVPMARLYLVGKNPSKSVLLLHNGKDIIVTGGVKDIRTYQQMGTVGIVSTRIAAGMQNKLVEAMAMKKAVVATTNANEGIGALNKKELYLADEPKEFSKYVIELMQDDKKRKQIENNARRFIEKKFTWEFFLEKLEIIMQNLIRRPI